MKKLLLTTVAALGLATPALAADIPAAGEPVAPAYIAPAAFNWSGPYVGLHLGYGFTGEFNNALDGASGFVGGLQAGYNVQFDPLVVGIEAEISYTDLSDKSGAVKADLNWKGTLTPRIGFAMDRFMPYVKAGLAYGSVEASNTTSDDATLWGWTVGVGAEYAVTNQISIKAEYAYTDLGSETLRIPAATKVGYTGSEVKIGLNYRF
ncbi:MAG: outer membrane protein [Labrys sp. (in: a-proteobacteria)]|jgi:outer membrane immunogenic protein